MSTLSRLPRLLRFAPFVLGPLVVGSVAAVGLSFGDAARHVAGDAVAAAGDAARGLAGAVRHDPTGDLHGLPASAARAEPARLIGVDPDGKEVVEFPLEHTTVTADVTGNIARVELQQVYANPLENRLEAVYKFPLPENAAVTDMFFRIGRRVVYSEVKKKDEAKATYEEAKAEGKTAALTEEDRPNLFTQSVANIPPGEKVVVVLRYVHEVPFADGRYRFVFPMTVGPRYTPATMDAADVAAVTAPVLAPEFRSAHEVDVTLRLHPAGAFGEVASVNHAIDEATAAGARVVTLADTPEEHIPNRDLVLEYRPASGVPEPFFLSEMEKGERYAMLFIEPPTDVTPEMVRPKEMIFLLDVSGSMEGEPIETGKELVRRSLAALGPEDTFQIVAFAGEAVPLEPAPLTNTPAHVKTGLDDLGRLFGGGGTEMLAGIKATLDPPADPARMRMVILFTDGWIGNEKEIIDAVEARRGETRVFGFGIGSASNRYLIEGVAAAGRGVADYVTLGEDADLSVSRLFSRLDRPLLTDLELSWDGHAPAEVYPARVPDLFAGQPLVVVARCDGDAPAAVTVKGKLGKATWARRVAVDHAGPPGGAVLGTLWARRKIGVLEARPGDDPGAAGIEEITRLGMKFKMVTPYTSLVAVERELRADVDLPLTTVLIPGELPEGTSFEAIFGPSGEGAPDGAVVTPLRVKPGDPEVRIDAPRSARVTVNVPWADEALVAVWDEPRAQWVARFLVPATWPDGTYGLGVHVDLGGGHVAERTAVVKVDTSSAAVAVVSAPDAVSAGAPFTLVLKPAVGLTRMAGALGGAPDARGALESLKSLSDVKDIVVTAPWGESVSAEMDPSTGAYRVALTPPAGTRAGPAALEIVAADPAGNVSRRTLVVNVNGETDANRTAAFLAASDPAGWRGSLGGALLVGLALVGAVVLRSRAVPRSRAR